MPRFSPGRRSVQILLALLTATVVALAAGVPVGVVGAVAAAATVALVAALLWDVRRSRQIWTAGPVAMTRQMPVSLAIGVTRTVTLAFDNGTAVPWTLQVHDGTDATLDTTGLPQTVVVPAGTRVEMSYDATPRRRGTITCAPADLLVRTQWQLADLRLSLGQAEGRRVYPDFAQVSRFAWLAGRRRLQELGIKTYQQRGEGTDFKQLGEYRVGDPIRHLDWRATWRLNKPIVRQFQDDRDQAVILLIDCGRRMRADDAAGGAHFDHVLNAVMLLSYVALGHGDAVGARTFGVPAGEERAFPPKKGKQVLHALMSGLYDVQPTLTQADYVAAAQQLLRDHPSRALVVLITNLRDEDSRECQQALQLLRSRHLVLLASLRERVIGEVMQQPIDTADGAMAVASAHLYEQARRDAFRRLSSRDGLMVDALPERLAVDLVNRYQAAKASGAI